MIKKIISDILYYYWILVDNHTRERQFMRENKKYSNIRSIQRNKNRRASICLHQTLYEARQEAKGKK